MGWTGQQLDLLRQLYVASGSGHLDLNHVAEVIGRSRRSVADKACALGLTNQSRRKKLHRKVQVKRTPEEIKLLRSEAAKKRIAEYGHPRGMLGKKHTSETLTAVGAASRRTWADLESGHNTEAERRRRSDWAATASFRRPAESTYSRCARGRREDLGGQYFRSSWEANYARYLELLRGRGEVVRWRYEARTFKFDEVPQIRSYTPDFEVTYPDGRREWHEVKGWMDSKSEARLDQMASYYPNEVVRVIGEDWFRQAKRDGLPERVPFWEKEPRRPRKVHAQSAGVHHP